MSTDPIRIVVETDETRQGPILPTEQAAIDRDVIVEADATVTDAIYGNEVTVEDGATIEGSIMASNSIEIGAATVHGEVGTPGVVDGHEARITGGVTATYAELSKTVVSGSIVADEVRLDDCFVVGVVAATEQLDASEGLCYTIESSAETRLSNLDVLFPQAIVGPSPDLDGPVTVVGLPGDDGPIELTLDDHYEYDGTYYLTVAGRILNIEPIEADLYRLEDQLQELLLSDDVFTREDIREQFVA